MSKWQPIETAPTDQKILVTDGEMVWTAWSKGGMWWAVDDRSGPITHWMPLPEPPKP